MLYVVRMDGTRSIEEARERVRAFFIATRLTRRRLLPLVVVGINVAVHLVLHVFGPRTIDGGSHPVTLALAGAKINELIWAGEWWRLVSCVFLHVDAAHLLVNCIGAFLLVQLADNVFGPAWVIFTYVLTGVAGSTASLLLSPNPSAGASGAIFGLLGALMAFALARRRLIPAPLRRTLLGVTAAWMFVSIAYSLASEKVDNAAHVGGLVVGLMLGLKKNLPVFKAGPEGTSWPARIAGGLTIALVGWAAIHAWRNTAGEGAVPLPPLAGVEVAHVYVPYPIGWKQGVTDFSATEGIRCIESMLAGDAERPLCFRDPYGTMFLVGRAGDLVPGLVFDPMMTFEYGQRVPRRVRHGDVTHYEIMLNREVTIILVGFDILIDRYMPMLNEILDGVRFKKRDAGSLVRYRCI